MFRSRRRDTSASIAIPTPATTLTTDDTFVVVEGSPGGGSPRLVPVRDIVVPRLEQARAAVTPVIAEARERLAPYVGPAREAVTPHLQSARERIGPHVEAARDTTRQVAAERVLPAAEAARERLAPAVSHAGDTVRSTVVPAVTASALSAYEASRPVSREARRRGEAAVAALRGERSPSAKRRWPVAVLCLLVGGGIGAIVGMLTGRRSSEPGWNPPMPGPVSAVPTTSEPTTAGWMRDAEVVESQRPDDPTAVVDLSEAEATRSEQ